MKPFFVFALLITTGCKVNQTHVSHSFTGMWKLDKYESFDSATNEWHEMESRKGYTGYIIYDGKGHMGVQLISPGLRDFNNKKSIDSLNMDEIKTVLHFYSSSFDYFGKYTISDKEKSIKHYRLSSNHPEEVGTTSKRSFEFKKDTLILTANELINGYKARLRWVKL